MKKLVLVLIACLGLAAGCDNTASNSLLSLSQATSLLTLAGTTTSVLTPGSNWYTMVGGSGTESATSVCRTADGGYIIAGSASADIPEYEGKTPINAYTGSKDILVVKLNSLGYVAWYTFLGSPSGTDEAYSVQQTVDKGYIIAGKSDWTISTLQGKKPLIPYSAGTDMLVIKMTSAGAVSWFTFLGGVGNDAAFSVQQTTDLGYIIAGFAGAAITAPLMKGKAPLNGYTGSSGEDMLIVKLTSLGALSWYTLLGGGGSDVATSICQTADKGYIIAGNSTAEPGSIDNVTGSFNPYNAGTDMMVVRLLPTGHVSWYTYIGSSGTDNANSVQQTANGGYIITGSADANIASLPTVSSTTTPVNAFAGGGTSDMLVVKLDATGPADWYTFLGSAGGYENATSIQQTADRGYIVAGSASAAFTTLQDATAPLIAYSGSTNALIVKLDEGGDVSGFTFLGGGTSTSANSIQQTTDGGYIVAGSSNGNIFGLGGMLPLYPYTGAGDFFVVKLNSGVGL